MERKIINDLHIAVDNNNIELIKQLTKEAIDLYDTKTIDSNNTSEMIRYTDYQNNKNLFMYYYVYSMYKENSKLIIKYLNDTILKNSEEVTEIFNHIIDYLKYTFLKESVERFFINQTKYIDFNIEDYLLDYYEYTLSYDIVDYNVNNTNVNSIQVILISDYHDYDSVYYLDLKEVETKMKHNNTYLVYLMCLFKQTKLIICNTKESYISLLAKNICKYNDTNYLETTDEVIISNKIKKIKDNLVEVVLYNQDKVIDKILIKSGSSLKDTELTKLNKDGYVITGYTYKDTNQIYDNECINKDTHIMVNYHKTTCIISYYDGVSLLKTNEVKYKSILDEHPVITKTGYTLASYKLNGNDIPTHYIVNDDITINCIFTINEYEVKYILDNEVYNTCKVKYNSKPNALTPTKDNLSFSGWFLDKELKTKYMNSSIKGDIILYGQMTKERVSIEINYGYTYFGKYPQTVELNERTTNELTKLISTNKLLPNSNGYYEYQGNEYAKVEANPFEDKILFSNDRTTIVKGKEYYFLVEKIKWKVISDKNVITLLSNSILDKQSYSLNNNTYPNNYKLSNVREWLNNTFYNKAFSSNEKASIATTDVNNSASTTNSIKNKYACDNTEDNVYLLSYKDCMSTEYGFENVSLYSKKREAKVTDYAKAIGCYTNNNLSVNNKLYGNGSWILRSPHNNSGKSISVIYDTGVNGFGSVDETEHGIRPVINVIR